MGNATSIFNLMRNIGGSTGIAFATTYLERRSQEHINVLGGHVDLYSAQAQQMISGIRGALIGRGVDAATAARQSRERCSEWSSVRPPCFRFSTRFVLLAFVFWRCFRCCC